MSTNGLGADHLARGVHSGDQDPRSVAHKFGTELKAVDRCRNLHHDVCIDIEDASSVCPHGPGATHPRLETHL